MMVCLKYEVVATHFFLEFSPLVGEDSHFDSYFSKGLKPPTSFVLKVGVESKGSFSPPKKNHHSTGELGNHE